MTGERLYSTTSTIFREFFMPRCGATFDENIVPPSTRGDTSRG